MDVKIPFKWVLTSQMLKNFNSRCYLEKYLCNVENGKLCLKLIQKKSGFKKIAIVLMRTRSLKSAIVKVRSHIAFFRTNPLTRIDNKQLKLSKNGSNCILNLKTAVWDEISQENKLIVKGKLNFRVSNRKDIKKNPCECLPTIVPERGMDCQVVKLSKDLEAMYNNSTYSDVLIICQSQELRAHKAILKARCPTMLPEILKNDPGEAEVMMKINIDRLSVLAVRTLIFYIYTGKLELETLYLAFELINAANMYNLKTLKEISIDFLMKSVNDENAIFIYSFSYSVDELLKMHALKYITQNFSSISNRADWEQLQQERPDLSTNILLEVVKLTTPSMIDLSLA